MTPQGIIDLKAEEAFRANIYVDSRGRRSIGYGTNLEAGISEAQAIALMQVKLADNRAKLLALPWFAALSPVRQDVIEDMTYNLGLSGLLLFKKMIAGIVAGDYQIAAEEMLDSAWSGQVGNRATVLSRIMALGVYPSA